MSKPMIIVKIQWTWGGAKVAKVDAGRSIDSVLKDEGFETIDGHKLIIAYNGQFVDPSFSFVHYSMKNGAKLVLALKKILTNSRALQFLESLKQKQNRVNETYDVVVDNSEAVRREEIARLTDLSFASWESMPEFPLIMNEIINSQEEQAQKNCVVDDFSPIDISPATSIQEDPLPNFLFGDSVNTNGSIKNGFGFNSGIISDTRSGNNSGMCEKKH